MSLIYLQIVSMAFLIIFVGISKVRILAIVITIIIMINKTSIKLTKPDKPKKPDIGCDRGSNRKGMAINDRTPVSILLDTMDVLWMILSLSISSGNTSCSLMK